MKQAFLYIFMYGFWLSVFCFIGWLFFSVKAWDKEQQQKQKDFKRSR